MDNDIEKREGQGYNKKNGGRGEGRKWKANVRRMKERKGRKGRKEVER